LASLKTVLSGEFKVVLIFVEGGSGP